MWHSATHWGYGGWGWYNTDWGDEGGTSNGEHEEGDCSAGFACFVLRCCCFEIGLNTCAWCGDDDFCVTRLCCLRMDLDEKSYICQCLCCKVTKHTNSRVAGEVQGLFQCVGWPQCAEVRCFCCSARFFQPCLFFGDDDLMRIRCACFHVEIDKHIERIQVCCVKCPQARR